MGISSRRRNGSGSAEVVGHHRAARPACCRARWLPAGSRALRCAGSAATTVVAPRRSSQSPAACARSGRPPGRTTGSAGWRRAHGVDISSAIGRVLPQPAQVVGATVASNAKTSSSRPPAALPSSAECSPSALISSLSCRAEALCPDPRRFVPEPDQSISHRLHHWHRAADVHIRIISGATPAAASIGASIRRSKPCQPSGGRSRVSVKLISARPVPR
jgi:hypothetical protein